MKMEPYVYCKPERSKIPKRGCEIRQRRNPFSFCDSCIQTRYVRLWKSYVEARRLEEGPGVGKFFTVVELLVREALTVDEPGIFERPAEYHLGIPSLHAGWVLVGKKKWKISYGDLYTLTGKLGRTIHAEGNIL